METIDLVEIYDVIGKPVTLQTFINKAQSASLQKQVIINCENLTNGIYFVKLFAGEEVYTTRLMLIK